MLVQLMSGLLAMVQLTAAAKLEKVADFGANPTRINMYIYVPDKLATKPATIVAVSIGTPTESPAINHILTTSQTIDAPLRRQRHIVVQRDQASQLRRFERLHPHLPRHSQHVALLGRTK